MVPGHQHPLRLQPHQRPLQGRGGRRTADQAGVERPVGNAGQDLGGRQQPGGDRDSGVPFDQGRQQGGGGLVADAGAEAERQRALRALGEAAHLAQHPVLLGAERRPALLQHQPGLGQPDRVGGPVEQPDPQLPLQLLDLTAQRGLGDVQPLGGAGEVQFLGHGQEVAEPPEF